jgi:hypothetical protein
MAVSTSKAMVFNQCLSLKCWLYFKSLFSSWISFSMNYVFEGVYLQVESLFVVVILLY